MVAKNKSNIPGSIESALSILKSFFALNNIPFCLIGGLAVQVRGKPRFTRDIDLTILATLNSEEDILAKLLVQFESRRNDALEFARINKVLLLKIGDIPVDVGIGLTGFEHNSVTRATTEKLTRTLDFPVCTAEDLIIHKILASRPTDLGDVKSILVRNSNQLDEAYILKILGQFEKLLEAEYISTFIEQKKQSSGNN